MRAGAVAAGLCLALALASADTVRLRAGATQQTAASAAAPAQQGGQTATSITGRTVEGLTDVVVPGATVTLGHEKGRTSVVADSAGRFSLTGLAPGIYSLSAAKAGYVSGSYGRRRATGGQRPLVLRPGEQAVVDISMWKEATISGTVRDRFGDPVVGQRVEVISLLPGGGEYRALRLGTEAVTDDRGVYTITGLFPGTYVVVLRSAASELRRRPVTTYPTVFHPATRFPGQARQIALAPAQEASGVDLLVEPVPVSTLTGTLVDPMGRPAPKLRVALLIRDDDLGSHLEEAVATTDEHGGFRFSGIPEGDYTLLAAAPEANPGEASSPPRGVITLSGGGVVAGGAVGRLAIVPVRVEADKPSDVHVRLEEGRRIHGRLEFRGNGASPSPAQLQRLLMTVELASGKQLSGITGPGRFVDGTGAFQTPALPPEAWFVRLVPPAGWTVGAMAMNGRDVFDEPVDLTTGDPGPLIITLVDRTVVLGGTVRDRTGRADPDATVLVFPSTPDLWLNFGQRSPRMREQRVDRAGQYVVEGLPAGEYHVIAVKDECAEHWPLTANLTRLAGDARRVQLVLGRDEHLDLETSASCTP